MSGVQVSGCGVACQTQWGRTHTDASVPSFVNSTNAWNRRSNGEDKATDEDNGACRIASLPKHMSQVESCSLVQFSLSPSFLETCFYDCT